MTITLTEWIDYKNKLSGINEKAASDFRKKYFIDGNGIENVTREEVTEYAHALATKYGEASAELACQMYERVAELEDVEVSSAVPAQTATYNETARAVNSSMLTSPDGATLDDVVSRLVKQAGQDTILKNAKRDKAEFAWIPQGDTCAVCLAIASQGWKVATNSTAQGNHAEHIHANCDCTFAVRFSPDTNYPGYNPDRLKKEYDLADGTHSKDKINSIRRMHYEENKDRINAQKRAAYARRKEFQKLESQK